MRVGHRAPVLAVPAAGEPDRAVHLDHTVRIDAGLLVQPVDVLRDDGGEPALTLQLDDREVAGVRGGRPRRIVEPAAPRPPADVGVGEVVLDRRQLLGLRVLRPHPVRAAEVRDPRIGRDPRAREHDDPLRRTHDRPRPGDVLLRRGLRHPPIHPPHHGPIHVCVRISAHLSPDNPDANDGFGGARLSPMRWMVVLMAVLLSAVIPASATAAGPIASGARPGATARRDVSWRPDASCDLATVAALAARHPDVRQFVVLATAGFAATERQRVRRRSWTRRGVAMPDRHGRRQFRIERDPTARRPPLGRRHHAGRRVPARQGHGVGRPDVLGVRQLARPRRAIERHVPGGAQRGLLGRHRRHGPLQPPREPPELLGPPTNGCPGSATCTHTPR